MNRLETLRLRFEKVAAGARCVGLAPSLSALTARANCFAKTPPAKKVVDSLHLIQEEYGGEALNCDDRFKKTWIGFLERMNMSCDVFASRSIFGNALVFDQLPQRLARAGVQCLSADEDMRNQSRRNLVSYVREVMSQTTPQSSPKLRRDMLTAMLDSFAYGGVGKGAPNSSHIAIATALSTNAGSLSDEWAFFLARVADQFDVDRARLAPVLTDLPLTTKQLGLAEQLLRAP